MYAVGLNTSGGPEVLEHPAPGQVRVKVRAAISPVDVMVRDGPLADWLTGNLAARLGRPVQRIAATSSERPYALWTPEIGRPVHLDGREQHFATWWESVQ